MVGFHAAGVHITIDNGSLREEIDDPPALRAWCLAHRQDPRTVAYLRMLGDLDDAAILGRKSLEDPSLPPLMRAVRRTRYAHVLQWQGAFTSAEEQFDLAAEETGFDDPTSPSSLQVLAAVFQHRAKCRFEHAQAQAIAGHPDEGQELWDRALEDARRSLAIRETLDSTTPDVLASSRQTLARLEGMRPAALRR